ncbi:MLX interacting protein mondo isoform X2 [Dermatophagoides farinae]|uniref:MLX interacting protein mondo isoform X2 n=1 Tax=Dermatophagoides farinae TaxID=6954 RepID=UPI003F6037F6
MYPSSSSSSSMTTTTTIYSSISPTNEPLLMVNNTNKMDNNQFNTMTNMANINDGCMINVNSIRRIKPSPKTTKENRIHSGHFMVSEIDENEDNETKIENDDHDVSLTNNNNNNSNNNNANNGINQAQQQQSYPSSISMSLMEQKLVTKTKTYRIRKSTTTTRIVSIDQSLWKLFQCMTLAYDDDITSPKWKTFKGLKMNIKDKIRLNNIIWRAWHIQYISGRKPGVCQFSSNIDTERHKKTEAILLEGKYWKRRADVVKAEYNKWRLYYQHLSRSVAAAFSSNNLGSNASRMLPYDWENNLPRWSNNLSLDSLFTCSPSISSAAFNSSSSIIGCPSTINTGNNLTNNNNNNQAMISQNNQNGTMQIFNDNIPSIPYTNYFDYASSREIARSGMGADFMQPGLEQLQPNIDFIDTFEQDFFPLRGQPTLSTVPEETEPGYKEPQEDLLDSLFNSCPTTSTNSNNNNNDLSPKSLQDNNYCQFASANNSPNQQINQQPLTAVYNPNNYGQPIFNINQPQQQLVQSSYKMEFESTMNTSNNGTSSLFPFHSNKLIQQQQQESNRQLIQMSANNSINYNPMNFAFNPSNTNDNTATIMTTNQQINPITMPLKKLIPNSSQQQSPQSSSTSPIMNLDLKELKNQALSLSCKNISQLQNSISTGDGTLSSSSSSYQIANEPNTLSNIGRSLSLPLDCGIQIPPQQQSLNHNKKFIKSIQQQQQQVTGPIISSMINTSAHNETSSFTNVQMVPATNLTIHKHQQQQQQQQQHTFVQNQLSPSSSSSSPPQSSIATAAAAFDLSNSSHSQMNRKFPLINNATGSSSSSSLSSTLGSLDYSCFKDRILNGPVNKYFLANNNNNNTSPTHDEMMTTMASFGSYSFPANTISFIGRNEHEHRNLHREHRERRRVCHINAEQKRRCNIKNGFDTLRSLLPSLAQNSNTKISKAAMLHKAADYIRVLKNEKFEQQKEYELLKQQIDNLNHVISIFQNQLPTTGLPIADGPRIGRLKEQYIQYVRQKTNQNWKFWIFSIIMESLLDSYCRQIATNNFDELCKTLFRWLDQGCSLVVLRKDVLNSLRFVSTSTNILTNPELLHDEIIQAISMTTQTTTTTTTTTMNENKLQGRILPEQSSSND